VQQLDTQGALAALVRELAFQGGLVAIDDHAQPPRWQLLVERETLRATALRDKLAAALLSVLGHPVQLDLQPGVPEDTPARRDAAARAARQAAAEAAIAADPLVQGLLGQFASARVVPGSVRPL
jgi:DNA polymerase-3 subunit gamma/tau